MSGYFREREPLLGQALDEALAGWSMYMELSYSCTFSAILPRMKTHLEIDDDLLEEVIRLGKFDTKKAAVHAALIELSKALKRRELLALRGKVRWQGDLDQLRAIRNAGGSGAR